MANFFNILNKKIIISAGRLSSSSSKDAISLNSERVYSDLAKITSYHNEVIYEAFRKLCSKPQFPHDVVESGISGNTVVTYLEEDGNSENNSALYWNASNNRPNTIKESFDYLLANLGVSQIVRETVQPDLENIANIIRCNTNNLDKLRKDIAGCKYVFDCTDTESYRWSLSKHVYELFTQGLISGHIPADLDGLNSTCGDFQYPQLSFRVFTNDIEEGETLIPQNLVAGCSTTLESQLNKIQDFIGMTSCEEALSELSQSCKSYTLPTESRNLKEYIKIIIDRLCNLPEGQGIDAVYLGVRDPEVGEDGNIQDAKPLIENTQRTSDALKYFHSSISERKGHWFSPNGDEQIVIGEFVVDSKSGLNDWSKYPSYSNPIPYTLFCYTSNKFLDANYEAKLIGAAALKRGDNRFSSLSLFEEINSFEETGTLELEYRYEQIGGVIRNDLTISDKEKDTGTALSTYTDSLNDYHIEGNGFNYENHLQIGGHTPVICIGPVDFGDKLIPVPLKWQKEIFGSTLEVGYGFVCSKKILSYGFLNSLYNNDLSGLDKKVGISLSSTRSIFNKEDNFLQIVLAETMHDDVYYNIINKAKPNLNINQVFGQGGPAPDVWKVLTIQYMRIML